MAAPMHIVIDARYVSRLQSGVGHYTEHLIGGLAAIDRQNRYTCLVLKDAPDLPIPEPDGPRFARWPTRVSFENHLSGDLWLLAYLPLRLRRLGTDVYHGPAVFLPLVKLGYRTVVTIHDLVSFLFPRTVPRKYALYMRLMTRLAVRSADRIIAVSGATRDDLTRVLRVPDDKVTVIHEAVAPQFAIPCDAGAVEAVLRRYGIRRPYCLFVGNLEPRKNLARLVEAFGLLRTRDLRGPDGATAPQLVLAGGRGWLYNGIFADLATRGGLGEIVFTGHVPAADLPALYAAAACFVFPSLYEGFGLPVLEAMAAGTPVVASRVGAIPEVAGDAALLVDARRPVELAEAIAAVLTDRALRARLITRGRARARLFSWEAVARQTLAVYESVRGDAAGPGV
ncbi:MAG: glycosyltransferase family 4 protein [Candidatus Rokubacteria bacterium]|nr:glycosyltransferase family 4 protein [Candidatus Rokubacteria bacterium]